MCVAREEPLIPEGCKINSEEDGSVEQASLGLCTNIVPSGLSA